MKEHRLYLGDLHTHTINSDGEFSYLDLAKRAKALGLDFLAFTDHNYLADLAELPNLKDLTLIPGVEWSHYLGHANFYGIDGPLEEPIFVNGFQGPESLFSSIHEKGAVVTLNHPFKEYFPFQFEMNDLTFDCLEVWNGPMGAANKQALDLWHRMLASGKRVTACSGSDYHNDLSTRMIGKPTTGVYADSANPADILEALRRGHCFVKASPQGPNIQLHASDGIMGDSVPWKQDARLTIEIERLAADDQVWMVSQDQRVLLFASSGRGDFHGDVGIEIPGFYRIEVMRVTPEFHQGEPVLISNPIYFE
ncbi:MAG: CehA/McbA family metallohydrolase [Anaerolineaceae bacterium]|nr:CehA/McbA family metallohydrolase [Anaerolineaceae bacterium]